MVCELKSLMSKQKQRKRPSFLKAQLAESSELVDCNALSPLKSRGQTFFSVRSIKLKSTQSELNHLPKVRSKERRVFLKDICTKDITLRRHFSLEKLKL